MTDIEIYKNEQFGEIRTVNISGEPWFVGKDVAESLGYKNPQEAIRNHVFDEDKGVSEILTPGGKQKMPVVNESGLYSLILSSKLPSAKEFKHWITSEVLPSIRSHGAYLTDDMVEKVLTDPDTIIRLAQQIKEAKAQLAQAEDTIRLMEPKAAYYDAVAESRGSLNFRETAKLFKIKERDFIGFLIEQKMVYRNSAGRIVPYADYNGKYFEIAEVTYSTAVGQKSTVYTKITPKGRQAIHNRLRREGKLNG
jgi:prophage antirepressor-like protein